MIVMGITVKFFANFREAVGVGKIEVKEAKDVSALFQELIAKFGHKLSEQLYEGKSLRDTVIVLVNGKTISLLDGLCTKLNDGDEVAIFPPVSGG